MRRLDFNNSFKIIFNEIILFNFFLQERDQNSTSFVLSEKPTLHEILMQEKYDFEAKVFRAAKRKRWLKGKLNQYI